MRKPLQLILGVVLMLVLAAVLVGAFLTLLHDGHRALAIAFGITNSYLVAVVVCSTPVDPKQTFTRNPNEEHRG